MVRSRDYRRFLAIQFAAPAERPILYALTAFAAEMSEIPNHVREPLAGFMRYAWWREALQAMEQGLAPRAHPLLQELAPWLNVHPAAFGLLYALIESGQHSIEDGKSEAQMLASDDAVTQLWKMALAGQPDTPIHILRSLPFGQRIGPLRILQLIVKGLTT